MCTVTFMPRRTGYCLAMNRDEKRTRATGLPPALRKHDGRQVVYPSEPDGGTWIALNDEGVTFALINWYSIPSRITSNIVSRGLIIPSLCGADSEMLADEVLATLRLTRIKPFRLIGMFPATQEIVEWRWDSRQLSRKYHRWRARQWISSGFDEPTAQKIRSRTFRLTKAQRSFGTIAWLRRLHRSHSPHSGPFSTCMHRDDACTVSYTEVEVVRRSSGMRHICGAPCNSQASEIPPALTTLRGL